MAANGDTNAITFSDVSKVYQTYLTPRHRLLEILSRGRRRYARETRALDGVSFALPKGGRLGILGENGSGKSTLLKILAGVLTPSAGTVEVSGRISALLELGAGFNPELQGAQNIRHFCMLHGMNKDEIDAAIPQITQFSELGSAIDHPVKTYSSGMSVRLGFACAVFVKPEILIVDEALSVGDAYFQNKCLHKIKALLDDGTTFIYVTHAADAVRALCTQGLWLDRGRVRVFGPASDVGAVYQAEVFRRLVASELRQDLPSQTIERSISEQLGMAAKGLSIDHARHESFEKRVAPLRTGSGQARILDIAVAGLNGEDTDVVEFNSKCTVRVFYRLIEAISEKASLTLGITDNSGRQIIHFNSALYGVFVSDAAINQLQMVEFTFENQLCPGEYGLVSGIGILSEHPTQHGRTVITALLDYCAGGARFTVASPSSQVDEDLWGLFRLNYQVSQVALE